MLKGLFLSKSAPWILLVGITITALVGATRGYEALGQYKASVKALEQRLEANRSFTDRIRLEAQRSAEKSREDMQVLQVLLQEYPEWGTQDVPESIAKHLSN